MNVIFLEWLWRGWPRSSAWLTVTGNKRTLCLPLVASLVHETSYLTLIPWKTQREMHKIFGTYLEEMLVWGTKNNMDQGSMANFSCKGPGRE